MGDVLAPGIIQAGDLPEESVQRLVARACDDRKGKGRRRGRGRGRGKEEKMVV
jgi:hypothetical protein